MSDAADRKAHAAGAKKAVIAALFANLAVTVGKFVDGLDTAALEVAIDRIEQRIDAAVPEATRIFIEAESLKSLASS